MGNITPRSYNPLVRHLEDAADGAKKYGAAIGLLHYTEARIRSTVEAIVGKPPGPGGVPPAVPGLRTLWNTADDHKCAMTSALQTQCKTGRLFARNCIRSLMPVLGETWNTRWKSAGFSTPSLAVPTNPLTMIQLLRNYYAANPAHESTDVTGEIHSAVSCDTMAKAIAAAETASNQSNTDSGTALTNFQTGLAAGRACLSGLRLELEDLINDDDERWYAFGYDKPSDPRTPDSPAHLTVVAGAPGSKTFISDWDDARRADTYRLCAVLKAAGTEVANEIVKETQCSLTLDTLAAGTALVLTVTARNDTGESGPSNPVEIAVP